MIDQTELAINLFAGFIGGLLVLIGSSLIPLIINKYWNRNLPAVYVTSGKGEIWNEAGITNHIITLNL
ncbi:MAG TPA: hypothetical protein VGJ92_09195 [Methanocella sp.]